MFKIKRRYTIIIIALVLLVQLVVFGSLGILYVQDKKNDSPFKVKFTSEGRLRWFGFESSFQYIPNTLYKDYTDSCTVVFYRYENAYVKLIQYKVTENGQSTLLNELCQSNNIKLIDTTAMFLYHISAENDTTLYKYEHEYLKLNLYDVSKLINNEPNR